MGTFGTIILTIFLFQASSKAAPNSDITENIDGVKSIEDGPKLDDKPYGVAEDVKTQNNNENNGRQKRYYDYVEFGIPPFFESNFPFLSRFDYNKRDELQNTDSLLYILRSLQKILSDARRQQSTPKPTQVHIPTYIPIFYVPQVACNCPSNVPHTPENNNNKDVDNNNNKQQPPPPTIAPSSEVPPTVPDLPNRFPAIDDMRQNWGTVVDQNQASDAENYDDDDDDGNRPISLEPVELPESLDIPAPPVEHGSMQAGIEPQTTTIRTLLPSNQASSSKEESTPSLCDAAIVSCCVRKEVTYNCFVQQGCPDPTLYGNPCEPNTFRQVLNRVHAYVKQRNG